MDDMPIVSILFYSVPESFLLFSFGLVVTGHKVKFNQTIIATAISVFLSYAVRSLPVPFGLHSVIGIAIIFLLFHNYFRMTIKTALISTMVSVGTLLTLENTVLYFFQLKFHLSLHEIWKTPILRTFIGWPHLFIWSVITIIIYRKKWKLLS